MSNEMEYVLQIDSIRFYFPPFERFLFLYDTDGSLKSHCCSLYLPGFSGFERIYIYIYIYVDLYVNGNVYFRRVAEKNRIKIGPISMERVGIKNTYLVFHQTQ